MGATKSVPTVNIVHFEEKLDFIVRRLARKLVHRVQKLLQQNQRFPNALTMFVFFNFLRFLVERLLLLPS